MTGDKGEKRFILGIYGLILAAGSLTTGLAIYGLIGTLVHHRDPWKGEQGALPVLWSFLLGAGFYGLIIFAGWLLYRFHIRKSRK